MEQTQLDLLLHKYKNNQLTDSEKEELDNWFHSLKLGGKDMESWLAEKNLPDELFRDFKIQLAQTQRKGRLAWFRRSAAAAVVLLVISLGAALYFSRQQAVPQLTHNHVQDIQPGSNKATLTLGNGKKIILAAVKDGRLAMEGGAEINKAADGQLIYKKAAPSGPDTVLNTMSTPVGGQYNLMLADGTRVWLNASSSIRYPTAFNGSSRQVEITGEAYFEVTHNAAKPFKVLSAGQQIEVLGTHFNVNAYENEGVVITTLLQGRVRVANPTGAQILIPGQQSVAGDGGKGMIKLVKDADTDEAVAWKEGYFQFNQADIHQVMRQLSRWYDIRVSYRNPSSARKFQGAIQRDLRFSQVLRILAKSNMHFTVKGKEVVVMD
nr:FecR family protein [Mucilaginibacter sp. L294]